MSTYEEFKNKGTGSQIADDECKIVERSFDKYQIKIKLSMNDIFLDIVEIKINKKFLSHKQNASSVGFHDVDEFYRE